jgi:hypothetical protein
MLEILLLVFVWILNFGISAYNAVMVGMAWRDKKYIDGWMNLVLWSVVVMSAAGFTWCYTIFLALIAGALGYLTTDQVSGALSVGYIIVIFPILMSGLVIWIHSLIEACRKRDALSIGVAGWNTFANVWNWYHAFREVPKVLSGLGDLFKGGGNSKDKGVMIMVILVIVSVLMGIITTYSLIKYGESYDTRRYS